LDKIKYLLYVNRSVCVWETAQPFLSTFNYSSQFFCITFFFFSSSGNVKHSSISNPNHEDSTSLLTLNKIMVWSSQNPNITLSFCLHPAFSSEELGLRLHVFLQIKRPRTVQILC